MKQNNEHINTLSKETKNGMKSRIIVGILMVIITIPAIFIGDYLFFVLVLFLIGVGNYETIKVVEKTKENKFPLYVYIVSYMALFIPLLLVCISNNLLFDSPLYNLITGYSSINIFIYSFGIIFVCYFLLSIFSKKINIKDSITLLFFTTLLLIGGLCFLNLRYLPLFELLENTNSTIYDGNIGYSDLFLNSSFLVLYVALGVCANDIFAYFTGVLFGKHKMCPTISPKKTWEGFVGGIVGSFLISFTFAILLAEFYNPLCSALTADKWFNILIISLILPFVGTLGDLIFSCIKRQYNVKDFGTILKSHGGILDRVDSLLISSIIATCILHIMTYFI